jgi:hypothetical protein
LAFLDTAANGSPQEIVVATRHLLRGATDLSLGMCAILGDIAGPQFLTRPVDFRTRIIKDATVNPDKRVETIAGVTAYVTASEHSKLDFSGGVRFALGALDQATYMLGYLDGEVGPMAARYEAASLICGYLDRYVDYFIEQSTGEPSPDTWPAWIALAESATGIAERVHLATLPVEQPS